LKIVYLASEVFPFFKTGGLADVMYALPKKMQELGHKVSIIMPKYDKVPLKYLEKNNERRKEVASRYIDGIKNPKIRLPLAMKKEENAFRLFPVFSDERDLLQKYLADNGIGTVIHYPIPPHKQKCYSEWNRLSLPVTEKIAAQELSLPIGPTITDEQIGYVIEKINEW